MSKLHLIYKYSDDSNQMNWGYEDVPWGLTRRHQSNSHNLLHLFYHCAVESITVHCAKYQCFLRTLKISVMDILIYHWHMFSVHVISTWSYCHGCTMRIWDECTRVKIVLESGRGMQTLTARRSCDGSSMAHCDGRATRKRWITIFCLTKPRRVRAYMLPSRWTKILTNLISKPTD